MDQHIHIYVTLDLGIIESQTPQKNYPFVTFATFAEQNSKLK